MINCSSYDTCSAPICPKDINNGSCIWYPDEAICKAREHCNLYWVRIQKRIARRARNKDRYFDLTCLNKILRVSAGIKGLDPNNRRTRTHDKTGKLNKSKGGKMRV